MDIIVFSDDYNWKGHPSSAMHLANHLLQARHRLIWFNIIYRPPTFTLADVKRTVSKLAHMMSAKPEQPPGDLPITVRSPFTVPYFVEPFRSLNRMMFRKQLRELDATLRLNQPVVIATNPFAVDFVRETRPWPSFYYCVDDYSEYPGVNRSAAISLERELLGMVDGVAATAMRLLETRRGGRNPMYLPHGVDVAHFASARRGERGDRPVIGFFGMLSDWVDVDYIARLAKLRPQWTIELLGRVDTDASVLNGLPNVKFTPPVPFAQLPKAAANFDVALIPFRINDLTRAVNPLKLLEYFAMGLPVVSTRLPEVERFQPDAVIADTAEDAAAAIDVILATDSDQKREQRVRIAADNSWGRRAQDLVTWIDSFSRG